MPKKLSKYFDYFFKSLVDKIFRKKTLTSILYTLVLAFISQLAALGNTEAIIEYCDGMKEKYEPDTLIFTAITILDWLVGKGSILVVTILGITILIFLIFRYLDKKNQKPATKEVVKETIDQIKQEEFTSEKIPQALNNIPSPPTLFIGREEKMKEVEASLAGEKPTLLLNGLGGIGKTALAMEYVNKKIGDYKHAAWISVNTDEKGNKQKGNSIEAIANDIELIKNLGLIIDPQTEVIHKARAILSKMNNLEGPNLLVIDNAGTNLTELIDNLPDGDKWQVLITSREKLGKLKTVRLDELSQADAERLFYKIHPQGISQKKTVKKLLERIGRHTLTLELFANTCEEYAHVDPRYLLGSLEKKEFEKLSEESWTGREKREVEVYSYLLAVLSIAKLEEDEKKQLIDWSVLPSMPIEWDLIKQIFQVEEEQAFSKTLRQLWKKGWLIRAEASNSYRCHQMIQEVIRKQAETLEEECIMVIEGISDLLSIDQAKDNPIDKFPFVIYGDVVLGHIEAQNDKIAVLQNELAGVYQALGQYEKATELLEKALESDLESFGEEHSRVAAMRSDLALVYQDLGQYEKAAELLEKALASDLESFGEDHPNTAIRRSNLALAYKALSSYERAAELLEKALKSDLESFGEDHPAVSISRSNLAGVYQDLGQYEKAAELMEKALESDLESFGEEHSRVSTMRSNLALVYRALGQYEKAAELLEKALKSDLESFGEDHPATARKRSNLAMVYRDLGQYEKAAELIEKALTSALESFGEAHPETAAKRSNLALVYRDLGQYDKAAKLMEKALTSALESFGEDHPVTAISRSNLASVYRDLGQYEKAAELMEKAFESAIESFGEEHPETATKRSNLAMVYRDLGQYEKAAELMEKAFESALESFGEEHPETATKRSNLAMVYRDLGQYEKAAELMEKAFESALESFGEAHPETANKRSNLAMVYRDLGQYEKAAELMEKAFESALESFGEAHPETANKRSNLALVYRDLGQYEKAAELMEKALTSALESFGEDHPVTAISRSNLGIIYYTLERNVEAKEMIDMAYATLKKILGPDHPNSLIVKELLDQLENSD